MKLLEQVLDKKELSGIDRKYASKILEEYLAKHPKISEVYLADPERFVKKKEYQKLRSELREELRKSYGVFFTDKYRKRDVLLKKLIGEPTRENADWLLAVHRSTNERLAYYKIVYAQLFSILGAPQSILDIGCGFNPFSYPYMHGIQEYHSVDIAKDDLECIGAFFESQGITHTEQCLDVSDPSTWNKFPEADVAFLFKTLDTLEDRNHNITTELLDAIPAKYAIVSFPTKTIGQKGEIRPREWFEALVTGRVKDVVTLPNEQFFIITLRENPRVTQ